MKQLRPQLRLSLAWSDPDIQEIAVYAASEHFSGATSLYVAPGELTRLADLLSGFPSTRDDQRTFELGHTELSGYGTVHGVLYCLDGTGHIGLHVEVFHPSADPRDKPQSCAILFGVLVSDLDRFVDALRCLDERSSQVATLENRA